MRVRTLLLAAAGLMASTTGLADTGTPKLTPKAAAAVQKFKAKKIAKPDAHVASGLKAQKGDTGIDAPAAPTVLRAAAAPSLTGRQTNLEVRSDGSLKATLGEEFMQDAIAVKNSDGTTSVSCQPHQAAPTFTPARPAAEKE